MYPHSISFLSCDKSQKDPIHWDCAASVNDKMMDKLCYIMYEPTERVR